MPTKIQVTNFFDWVWRAFPTIVVAVGIIVGNFIYKQKDEFQEAMMIEISRSFVSQKDADLLFSRTVSKEIFEDFKSETNTQLDQSRYKLEIHQATVSGQLARLEADVKEIKTDLREFLKRQK